MAALNRGFASLTAQSHRERWQSRVVGARGMPTQEVQLKPPLRPKLAKRWTGKAPFGAISRELLVAEGLAFQRITLSLIRLIWPEAVESPSGWSFDRGGADHLVWTDGDTIPLVVQCKGFRIPESELGQNEINQCLKSIASLRKLGRRVDRYVIIHNREGRTTHFRDAIGEALRELVDNGIAESAEIWNRQRLLHEAFEATERRALAHFKRSEPIIDSELGFQPIDRARLQETVPLEVSMLSADQHALREVRSKAQSVDDPLQVIREPGPNLNLLLGEFGFGKTTALRRLGQVDSRSILYCAGARIDQTVIGAKDLMARFSDVDAIFADLEEADRVIPSRMLRGVWEYLLKDSDLPVVLVLDGLDESLVLTRRGGVQQLFNMLRTIEVPVIVAMRSEFWNSKQVEFESALGTPSTSGLRKYVQIRVVELLPWSVDQIVGYVKRAFESEEDADRRGRLSALEASLATGEFDRIYEDIPRRPLFLEMIVQSVADKGLPIQRVRRAALFSEWARAKILRDIIEPVRRGGAGRILLQNRDETAEAIVEVSWTAMIQIADQLWKMEEDQMVLIADADWSHLRNVCEALRDIREPLALVLHSLLVFTGPRTGLDAPRIGFSHRSYQEFFVATALLRSDKVPPQRIPTGVARWISDIEHAGEIAGLQV
jgi:hypothetical protein